MHGAVTRGRVGSWDGEAGMRAHGAQRKASRGTQGSWEKEVCGRASRSGVGKSSQEEEDRRRYGIKGSGSWVKKPGGSQRSLEGRGQMDTRYYLMGWGKVFPP